MIAFLIRRILSGIVVLWVISMLVFALFFAVPNNVARKMAGHQATPATIQLIENRLHLDEPLYKQYGHYMERVLFHFDFGQDYYFNIPVADLIKEAAPVTASLTAGAAIIWLILGVLSGVVSAVRPRSLLDRILTITAVTFYSVPSFVLGLTLLYFLWFQLTQYGYDWFPPAGYVPMSEGIYEWSRHLILPWITLAMISAATYSRLTRGSMLEVLSEDYIRTARAKGLSERRVNYRHALRSALNPIVTQFGIDVGALLGGAVITEQVFSLDGLGSRSIEAIRNQDLPVVMGIVLLAAAFVVIANIVVDCMYAVLDPRVRLS